ncbi:MAG: leucine-rich repeat domain-containing protein [Tannerellaceae bacterium]|jgi:hypothetical protein|nr:leucine-rich repeat domain-containing protein [Tannerellaceae bacterium]
MRQRTVSSTDLHRISPPLALADFTGGDFNFMENGDNCTLTGYSGAGGNVDIPSIATKTTDGVTSIYPVTFIGNAAFSACPHLASVTVANSVTAIGEHAFYNCRNISSIAVSDSLASIGLAAFLNCVKLASMTIPGTVTAIGEWAFRGCVGLKDITVSWATPLSINENTFEDTARSKCTLHVPAGTESLYKAAEGWRGFNVSGAKSLTVPDNPANGGIIVDSIAHSSSKSGYLILRLEAPSDNLVSGTFFVVLPAGLNFDSARTALLGSLPLLYKLSVTEVSDNTWLFGINPKTRRTFGPAFHDLVKIAYTADESMPDGGYEIKIRNLEFILVGNAAIRENKIVARVASAPSGKANKLQ